MYVINVPYKIGYSELFYDARRDQMLILHIPIGCEDDISMWLIETEGTVWVLGSNAIIFNIQCKLGLYVELGQL